MFYMYLYLYVSKEHYIFQLLSRNIKSETFEYVSDVHKWPSREDT